MSVVSRDFWSAAVRFYVVFVHLLLLQLALLSLPLLLAEIYCLNSDVCERGGMVCVCVCVRARHYNVGYCEFIRNCDREFVCVYFHLFAKGYAVPCSARSTYAARTAEKKVREKK